MPFIATGFDRMGLIGCKTALELIRSAEVNRRRGADRSFQRRFAPDEQRWVRTRYAGREVIRYSEINSMNGGGTPWEILGCCKRQSTLTKRCQSV